MNNVHGTEPVFSVQVELNRKPNGRDEEAIYRLIHDRKENRDTIIDVYKLLDEFFDATTPKPYKRYTEDHEEGLLLEVARFGDPREENCVVVVINYGSIDTHMKRG